MRYAPQSDSRRLQPPLEYDFAGGVVLFSSEHTGWVSFGARYYRSPAHYHASVPAFDADLVSIQMSGSTPLTSKLTNTVHHLHSNPGDIYVVPKGESSEWHAQESCELLHLSAAPTALSAIALQVADLDPQRVELVPQVQLRDPLFYQLGRALLAELRAESQLGRLYVESISQLLLVHMIHKYAASQKPVPKLASGLPRATLRRVLDYIGDNLAHELVLGDIARVAGMSSYHFMRLFKQSVGQTLHRYVTQQRLSEARRLLLVGKHPIAEVAHLTGFADQSHLHRCFKAAYGVTPGALLAERTNLQRTSKNIQDNGEAIG